MTRSYHYRLSLRSDARVTIGVVAERLDVRSLVMLRVPVYHPAYLRGLALPASATLRHQFPPYYPLCCPAFAYLQTVCYTTAHLLRTRYTLHTRAHLPTRVYRCTLPTVDTCARTLDCLLPCSFFLPLHFTLPRLRVPVIFLSSLNGFVDSIQYMATFHSRTLFSPGWDAPLSPLPYGT